MAIVDGIDVSVSAGTLEDYELFEAIAATSDEGASDAQRMAGIVKVFKVTFGGDYARVKRELRERHGGRLTLETMQSFYQAVLEAVGSKN